MALIVFVLIVLFAIVKPNWIFPLLVPVGLAIAAIGSIVFVLGTLMRVP